MKYRLNLTALFIILGTFCFASVLAQDDQVPDLDSNKEIHEPASELLPEGEVKSLKPIISRDSIQVKSLLKKPENKTKSDENHSVLSFNFLYYLIERYKLSDIID